MQKGRKINNVLLLTTWRKRNGFSSRVTILILHPGPRHSRNCYYWLMIVRGCVIFERTLLSRKKSNNLAWSCAISNIFYCARADCNDISARVHEVMISRTGVYTIVHYGVSKTTTTTTTTTKSFLGLRYFVTRSQKYLAIAIVRCVRC